MFALLWRLPFNKHTWTAEAQPGVPFLKIDDPSDGQEANYIVTEHKFMKNEWASAKSVKEDELTGWRRFVTSAYNNPLQG